MKRTLALKAEHLTELSSDDLVGVAGGDASGVTCVTRVAAVCQPSDYFISLCGCFTHYCSIDVC